MVHFLGKCILCVLRNSKDGMAYSSDILVFPLRTMDFLSKKIMSSISIFFQEEFIMMYTEKLGNTELYTVEWQWRVRKLQNMDQNFNRLVYYHSLKNDTNDKTIQKPGENLSEIEIGIIDILLKIIDTASFWFTFEADLEKKVLFKRNGDALLCYSSAVNFVGFEN